MRALRTLVEGGTFFEGARWRDGRWWVSDFYANRVIAIDADGRERDVMSIEQPSGLGWLPDGSLLAVSMTGHSVYRRAPSKNVPPSTRVLSARTARAYAAAPRRAEAPPSSALEESHLGRPAQIQSRAGPATLLRGDCPTARRI